MAVAVVGSTSTLRLLARQAGRSQPPDRPPPPAPRPCHRRGRRRTRPFRGAQPQKRSVPESASPRRNRPLRRPHAAQGGHGRVPPRRTRSRRQCSHRPRGHRRRDLRHGSDARAGAVVAHARHAGHGWLEPLARWTANPRRADDHQLGSHAAGQAVRNAIYAPGTTQNWVGAPGHYRFYIARGLRRLAPPGRRQPASRIDASRHAWQPHRARESRSPAPPGSFAKPTD